MVDIGGGLPGILNSILDAVEVGPLIVEGTYDSSTNEFSPRSGQPTYQEAKEAFESGKPVFLQFSDEKTTSEYNDLVVSYTEDGGASKNYLRAGVVKWLES